VKRSVVIPSAIVVAALVASQLAAVPAAVATSSAKARKPTAAVTAEWTIKRASATGDVKESWEEVKVTLKAKGLKRVQWNHSAIGMFAGKGDVTIQYTGRYLDDNTAWYVGCETEQVDSSGSWSGSLPVVVKNADDAFTHGKTIKFRGWQVYFGTLQPLVEPTITGSTQEYENPLTQTNCLTIPWGTQGEHAFGGGNQWHAFDWGNIEANGVAAGPVYGHPNDDQQGALLTLLANVPPDNDNWTFTSSVNGSITFSQRTPDFVPVQ
jgi:hypothetical protein